MLVCPFDGRCQYDGGGFVSDLLATRMARARWSRRRLTFGARRGGNAAVLRDLGAAHGSSPRRSRGTAHGEAVSSSRIRRASSGRPGQRDAPPTLRCDRGGGVHGDNAGANSAGRPPTSTRQLSAPPTASTRPRPPRRRLEHNGVPTLACGRCSTRPKIARGGVFDWNGDCMGARSRCAAPSSARDELMDGGLTLDGPGAQRRALIFPPLEGSGLGVGEES